MPRFRALVAGATGVVGHALVRHLHAHPDWEVVGASRTPPADSTHSVVAVDLANPADRRRKLAPLSGITHVLYCARASHTVGVKESIDENLAMLRNVLDAVESASPGLRHVHIVQGSKVYGSEAGPYRTPARESDPRVAQYNWYYAQEDLLRTRSAGRWTWSASRPHGVCEGERAVGRNLATLLALYAAIRKAQGLPLDFPGTQTGFHALYQSVDAGLLARAITWIVTTPACANRAFNVTNGDCFRWSTLWPGLAEFFGMAPGAVRTTNLAGEMPGHAAVWQRVAHDHALARPSLFAEAVWSYADFNLGRGYDVLSSTVALRQTGFAECMDTEGMFVEHLRRFRAQRAIP